MAFCLSTRSAAPVAAASRVSHSRAFSQRPTGWRAPAPRGCRGTRLVPCASIPPPSRPTPPVMQAPRSYVDPFAAVVEAERKGDTVQVKVKALNKGGLVVTMGETKGFIPYNQLVTRATKVSSELTYLVGQTLSVKVLSVDAARKEFVVSERKVQQSELMKRINVTKLHKAVVTSVADYGAFVELVDLQGLAGLVHRSELSWDSFVSVDEVITAGQVVMVKVIDLDVSKCRLGLSIKQTQPDPIKQTLDTVVWGRAGPIPEEIQAVVNKIKGIDGVEGVTIGRQATESHIASQEMVVYMTKVDTEAGFNVVARLGSVLQELNIATRLSREEMRRRVESAVQAR
ncbi:hypothetical protein FOA52_000110 [Chlamydomonas sp. UWO 241]|nr:hypothetical protein FOA52_000110 [Chlamydomonas sp. UWO 241]